jgi:hypothetical protein
MDHSEGNSPMLLAGSLLVRDTGVSSPVKDAKIREYDMGSEHPVELESASDNSCTSVILVEDVADDHAYYYDEVVYVSDEYVEEDDDDEGNTSIQLLEESADDDVSRDSPKKMNVTPTTTD